MMPHRSSHRLTACVALTCVLGSLWLLASTWANAQPAEKEKKDPTDWPTIISRLQEEVYRQPGFAQTRQQLAIAYNNYGVSLGNERQWSLAVKQLEEAIRLDGGNEQFRNNLGSLYCTQAREAYQDHREDEAMLALERALASNPRLVEAYVLRGDIQYGRQRLKEAAAAWQQALELDPKRTEVKERLDRVTQEIPVESRFERLSQAYFDLRYEDQLERPAGFDVRDALLDARRLVGSDFAYWPKYKLVVLVYSAEKFHALRQETPDWVGGQFDGKIRVPLPSAQLNPPAVKQILFHEYTHALIHDLTDGKCPTWLNEGLAEYEGRSQLPGSLAALAKAYSSNQLIPWQELSDHFSFSLSAEEVALAYQQSYSLVAYLIKRYGFWRIRRVLKALGEGQPWDAAVAEEFHLPLSKLDAYWRSVLPEFLGASP